MNRQNPSNRRNRRNSIFVKIGSLTPRQALLASVLVALALIGISNFVSTGVFESEAADPHSNVPDQVTGECWGEMIRNSRSESSAERYERHERGEFKCWEK